MAKTIIADSTEARVERAPEASRKQEELETHGFKAFSWLGEAEEARHGKPMTEAFNLARSLLHGNAALLELLEDENLIRRDRPLGIARTGDLMRFLVTVNDLANHRMAELHDEIAEEVKTAQTILTDFEARR